MSKHSYIVYHTVPSRLPTMAEVNVVPAGVVVISAEVVGVITLLVVEAMGGAITLLVGVITLLVAVEEVGVIIMLAVE